MTTLREAGQQALDALEFEADGWEYPPAKTTDAITALRAALAQEQAEPVAWTLTKTLDKRETTTNGYLWFSDPQNSSWTPLYTSPPQRRSLTDEEIDRLWHDNGAGITLDRFSSAVRAVERAHGIGEDK